MNYGLYSIYEYVYEYVDFRNFFFVDYLRIFLWDNFVKFMDLFFLGYIKFV